MSTQPWTAGRPEAHGSSRDGFTRWGARRDRQIKTARLPRRAPLIRRGDLTETGTILLTFAVTDDEQFGFAPGQFVAIDQEHPTLGYRRSPYCLYGASVVDRTFELLVRIVPQGPVSIFLGQLEIGDLVSFRGPSGHSMIPKEPETHLVLIATGVGLGPCRLLLRYLKQEEPTRKVTLYWGLRLESDICLLDELIALERAMTDFDWNITLSAGTEEWPPLKGRVTETVPPILDTLADKHF